MKIDAPRRRDRSSTNLTNIYAGKLGDNQSNISDDSNQSIEGEEGAAVAEEDKFQPPHRRDRSSTNLGEIYAVCTLPEEYNNVKDDSDQPIKEKEGVDEKDKFQPPHRRDRSSTNLLDDYAGRSQVTVQLPADQQLENRLPWSRQFLDEKDSSDEDSDQSDDVIEEAEINENQIENVLQHILKISDV